MNIEAYEMGDIPYKSQQYRNMEKLLQKESRIAYWETNHRLPRHKEVAEFFDDNFATI